MLKKGLSGAFLACMSCTLSSSAVSSRGKRASKRAHFEATQVEQARQLGLHEQRDRRRRPAARARQRFEAVKAWTIRGEDLCDTARRR